MGGMASIMSMMPGMGQLKGPDLDENEKTMGRVEAIILSMTAEERRNPDPDESVPQETNRTGRRRGHRRSQPPGKTVRRYEKLMKQLPGMAGGGKRKGSWRIRRYAWQDEAAVLNKC